MATAALHNLSGELEREMTFRKIHMITTDDDDDENLLFPQFPPAPPRPSIPGWRLVKNV